MSDTQETRRHKITMHALTGVTCAAIAGFTTYLARPAPPTIESLQTAITPAILSEVRAAVAQELEPYKRELALTKLTAEQARSDATLIRQMLAEQVSPMSRQINAIEMAVKILEERTRKVSPG
jgi:hypothetical protein